MRKNLLILLCTFLLIFGVSMYIAADFGVLFDATSFGFAEFFLYVFGEFYFVYFLLGFAAIPLLFLYRPQKIKHQAEFKIVLAMLFSGIALTLSCFLTYGSAVFSRGATESFLATDFAKNPGWELLFTLLIFFLKGIALARLCEIAAGLFGRNSALQVFLLTGCVEWILRKTLWIPEELCGICGFFSANVQAMDAISFLDSRILKYSFVAGIWCVVVLLLTLGVKCVQKKRDGVKLLHLGKILKQKIFWIGCGLTMLVFIEHMLENFALFVNPTGIELFFAGTAMFDGGIMNIVFPMLAGCAYALSPAAGAQGGKTGLAAFAQGALMYLVACMAFFVLCIVCGGLGGDTGLQEGMIMGALGEIAAKSIAKAAGVYVLISALSFGTYSLLADAVRRLGGSKICILAIPFVTCHVVNYLSWLFPESLRSTFTNLLPYRPLELTFADSLYSVVLNIAATVVIALILYEVADILSRKKECYDGYCNSQK